MSTTLEDRLRAVEDKLAILHLIASHPPAADTGNDGYYRDAFAADAVVDLGTKSARGNEAIASVVKTPEHQGAIAAGLCHFAGLPRVEINGDTAVAISYLQVLTPNRDAAPQELSGHGSSSGYRIHRLGANRWDLKRTENGWKVVRRAYRMLDGNEEARAMLREAVGAA
ncbi:MAG TPA: nuclear transport factor 2 family protein [Xanthobacteraceae bacterium]|nr:nuclear transport factor 2 family protein [Xanthobacteraceae bacterium]